jgi:phosphoribosylanthranilate isomerase
LCEGLAVSFLIQIYEVQTPEEAEALFKIGVDHIGSVLVTPDFQKRDSLSETFDFVDSCGKTSSLIPLFREPDLISRALDHYRPGIVHFCDMLNGNGSGYGLTAAFDRQRTIRDRFPEIQIMRSVPIAQTGLTDRVPTLDIADMFEPISDFFLTDTLLVSDARNASAPQPVDGFIGITGTTCDWDMASKLVAASGIPVILAGGISTDNVLDGLNRVKPAGVDSCTLTNAVDGNGKPIRFKKDMEKVKLLVDRVRRNDYHNTNEPEE